MGTHREVMVSLAMGVLLSACAGEGHYFEAHNAQDLSNAFATIARSIGDLRISK